MIDAALLEKKLAFIETCLRELRELAVIERLGRDVREQRFVYHTLQLALQSALDVASHIVSARRLGEPSTNRALFDLVASDGWVEPGLLPALQAMAGLRNILVHGYQEVDNGIVSDVVSNHLGDLQRFVNGIRERLR
jgi:uncharacterized protein YutE (UPF0331/DUF86 family)